METAEKTAPSGKLKGFTAVSLLTLLSRITGLARDALMASTFGTGTILDAFTLAFRIPNMFRRLFGDGAMAAALLPEFVRADQQEGREAANRLFSGVARRLAAILLAFVVAAEIGIAIVYFNFEISDRMQLLCELSLILMPYSLLICMAGAYSAVLNGVQHFTFPALAPVLLNLVWLGGGLLAAALLSTGVNEARLISVCILLGGCIQLGMVVFKARQFDIHLTGHHSDTNQRVSRVIRAITPVMLGLTLTQLNGIFDSVLAWGLSSGNLDRFPALERFRLPIGTAAALYLGQRLFQFPLGITAVALGTVLFPRFAKHSQSNDFRELNTDVIHGLQLVLLVGIPASVGLWFMAAPITDLLFRYGQFDARDAFMTQQMIVAHAPGVWIFSGLLIVNRVFYAVNDQITPMRQAIICVGLNLVLDIALLPLIGGQALPLANVLANLFQLGLALEVLRARFLKFGHRDFVPLLWRIVLSSLVMNLAGLGALYLVSWSEPLLNAFAYRGIKVGVPVLAAVAAYAVALKASGVSIKSLLDEPFSTRPRSSSSET